MKIILVSILILFALPMILSANQAHAPCPGGPSFNCNDYPESNQFDNPQIINLKVFPSEVKVGDKFSITATFANNSPSTVYLYIYPCGEPFSVNLDKHAKVEYVINLGCPAFLLTEKVDPGQGITKTSPSIPINPSGKPSTFVSETVVYRAIKSGTANATVTFSYAKINQTDSSQIRKTVSKSILFTIQDNNTKAISSSLNHSYPATLSQSPLKQFKSGIAAKDVKCKEGLHIMLKQENGQFACVKMETANKLFERGWGIFPLGGLPTSH